MLNWAQIPKSSKKVTNQDLSYVIEEEMVIRWKTEETILQKGGLTNSKRSKPIKSTRIQGLHLPKCDNLKRRQQLTLSKSSLKH